MPTYDYRCDECDHEFEEFQSIKAAPLETCPKCKGPVRRLISSGNGIIFKGSGFYITDYKRSHNRSDSQGDSDSKKEDKAGTKSDAKSETKESKSSNSDSKV